MQGPWLSMLSRSLAKRSARCNVEMPQSSVTYFLCAAISAAIGFLSRTDRIFAAMGKTRVA